MHKFVIKLKKQLIFGHFLSKTPGAGFASKKSFEQTLSFYATATSCKKEEMSKALIFHKTLKTLFRLIPGPLWPKTFNTRFSSKKINK